MSASGPDQISAGGVAFREDNGRIEVVLIAVGERLRWQLPKGRIDPGETAEQAAQREVSEEAGIQTELLVPLDTIEYSYWADTGGRRVRANKEVRFFLMRYRSGDVNDHDDEVMEARWFDLAAAERTLTFESERRVLALAADRIRAMKREQAG